MHSYPPVSSGAATTLGLNAKASPHSPAPATTTLTLNRSKIAMVVDSSSPTYIVPIQVVQQNCPPYRSRVRRLRQLSVAKIRDAPRRTVSFPNGDVRHVCARVHRSCSDP